MSDALEINYAPKYNKAANLFKRDPKGAILPADYGRAGLADWLLS